MTDRPRLLDLFCGAGGAAMGYYRVGFDVVGVDIKPQPRYPFEFVQGDALEYCAAHGAEFDAIHASPPCQGYSISVNITKKEHPKLIGTCRNLFSILGVPWVIENVYGARRDMVDPTLLCGAMFGLKTYRHRLFETSFAMPLVMHPSHGALSDRSSGPSNKRERDMVQVWGKVQYAGYLAKARDAMGIDWMSEAEIAQAIPPAYTEFIGRQLIGAME